MLAIDPAKIVTHVTTKSPTIALTFDDEWGPERCVENRRRARAFRRARHMVPQRGLRECRTEALAGDRQASATPSATTPPITSPCRANPHAGSARRSGHRSAASRD